MKYFIVDNKDGKFEMDIDLARVIYRTLNKSEQDEISAWFEKNPNAELNKVITILYGTLSQRRRMNPRLVKAVVEYRKNHKKCNLVPIEVSDGVKYLTVTYDANGAERLVVHSQEDYSYLDSVEKWINQQTVFDEIENEFDSDKDEEVKEFTKSINKVKIKIKLKRLLNKIRRWFYSLTHPNVRKYNKNKGRRK